MSANGYNTAARSRILGFLMENKDRTVNANDILKVLNDGGNEVNITTIYRYLDKLTESGQVMKYVAENGTRAVYQYVEHEHHCEEHLHLQCTKCGAIIHLDCSFMDEIAEHISLEHGFQIQCKNSIIYGVCRNCLEKAP
ncbi:MAG: transcriptional repressor [Spirochaetales bacterium]|nr:transcriptional repressor [Spirochaetales bacterium]